MPNAGYRVTIDTSSAIAQIASLREQVQGLRDDNKLSAAELDAFKKRIIELEAAIGDTRGIEASRKAMEANARAMGLSEKEAKALGDRVAQNAAQHREAASGVATLGSTLGGIIPQITAVVGAYVSLREVTSLLSESTQLAARYDTLGVVLKTVGANAGYATEYLNGLEQSLQRSGISMNSSRQSLAQMIEAHMDLASATKISRAAQDAAVIAGINSSKAFERMTTAIQSAQPEMLRTMGINVNFDVSYQKLAASMRTTTEALTEQEKAMARTNAVMEASRTIRGTYEASMNTPGKQALSLQRYWEDFKTSLGQGMQPGYSELIQGATYAVKEFTATVKDPAFQESMKEWGASLGNVARSVAEIAKYSGMRSPVMTEYETKKLADQGRIPASGTSGIDYWGKQATHVGVFGSGAAIGAKGGLMLGTFLAPYTLGLSFPALTLGGAIAGGLGARSLFDSPNEALQKQKIAASVKLQDSLQLKKNNIFYEYDTPVNIESGGFSGRGMVTKGLPEDLQKQLKAQEDEVYRNLTDYAMPYITKNSSYLSTSEQLKYADDTYAGEKKNFELLKSLAQKRGDSKMEENAVMGLNEAYQKNLQIKSQLIKVDDDVRRSVQALSSVALSAQSDLFGDSRTSSAIKDLQTYNDELAQFRARMATYKGDDKESVSQAGEYWINYNKGIRDAKRELEDFRNTLSTVGDLMSDLGRLSGSPEASYQGAMFKLKAQYKDASDQAKALGISQDLVDQAYTLKAREAWQESYKGLTNIDGSAFDARRAMLSREVDDFRKAGADEIALRIYAAQKSEDIARDELQARQAYAGNFTDFLRGQVNIELGLYQGAHSRQLQEWQDYYNDLKQLGQGWMDTAKSGFVDLIDGAVTNKGEDAWKNMLANMRRQTLQFFVDIAMDFAKANIFKPALSGALGIGGNETGTKTVEGAARGLSSQAVSAPSNESVLSWLGQGVPTFTPAVVEQMAAPAKQAAEAVTRATSGPIWQRNNNPGNLRSVAGPFQRFDTMEDGTRAMSDWLVRNGKRGYDTPEKILGRYAPPSENDTEKYIKMVENGSGFARDQRLDLNDPDVRQRLMRPMIQVETGRKDAVPDDMLYRATHLAKSASLSYGSAGEEGTRAVASAASSYGMLGVNFGQLGAQSILSKIDTRGGLWSAMTGDSASYAWNTSNVTQAGGVSGSSFWTAPTGGNVWDVSTYTSALSGLSSTDATTAAKLVAMGMSPDDAVTLVTGSSSGSSSVSQAVNSQTAQQGTNFNASDLLKDAGSGSWVDSLNQWGFDNLGIGSDLSGTSVEAFAGKNVTGWTGSTAGLGSIAAGALTGATTGFGISSLVYPNGTGTVGGTLGGLAGGAIGSALLGSTIGGPIGGIVGGLLGSILGGSETKTTEKTGSGVTVTINNGNVNQQGYSTYRTTTSGMFGSSSTSHTKSYDTVGDPELERAFASALETYTAQNWRSSVNMGISTASLKSFSFPFSFDIDDENASFAAKAVANYQAYQLLDSAGLREEFDEVAKSGEVYVDQLKRISDAYNTGSIAASAAGTSLEKLAGTVSTVFQGDWFSDVADLLGGTDQASSAFSTYIQYGLSKTQAVDYALSAYAGGAGSAIAQLGDSSVNMENFWSKYQEAMNAGNISADQFALWANAAGYMSSYSDTQYEALGLMQTINNVRIAQLKQEMAQVQNVKVMVDGLNTSVSSAYSTYKSLYDTLTSSIQSITWNSSLSTNTPTTTFKQQQAYYNYLKNKVANEDSSSLTYSSDISKLSSFSQTYLQTAKSYYGASSAYFSIFNDVTGTLEGLQATTKTELDYLAEQLTTQYTLVNQNQAEIDQLTLANQNLQILGAGLDGLGVDISSGLSAIVNALGSSWGSSWTSSVASAMDAYASAYAATTASLATMATVDTSSLTSTDWSSLSTLTGYATGGDPTAGEWAYVGEQGPELVRFGKDARVYNANETKGILAAKGGDSKAVVAALQSSIAANAAGQSAMLEVLQGLKAEFAAMRIATERAKAAKS